MTGKPTTLAPMTVSAFAVAVGMSQPWVSGKIKEGMGGVEGARLQGSKRVAIRPEIAIPWLIKQAREEGKRERKGDPVENPGDRLKAEQADRVAAENALRRGELCETADVTQLAIEAATAVRNELDGLPGRLANQLAGLTAPEIRERLRDEVTRVEANAARRFGAIAGDPSIVVGDGAGADAAKEEKPGRVGGRKPRVS